MGNASKRKGRGFELEVVRILQGHGMVANKMPLSGALPDYSDDIGTTVQSNRKLECKRRERAFSTLYGWIEIETRNGRQGRIAEHLTRMDFIVLDELGYLPFAQSGGQLLFHLVSRLPAE